MPPPDEPLPLFHGPHVPQFRFERALDALDLDAALLDAPAEWKDWLRELKSARTASALAALRRDTWPHAVERVWSRLLGRALDRRRVPGILDGEPAAVFLYRGGEHERAEASLGRHLVARPADPAGWFLGVLFEPLRGAARAGFHGAAWIHLRHLPGVADLAAEIEDDEQPDPARWLLPYAVIARRLPAVELRDALEAEGLGPHHLPLPTGPVAFAAYLAQLEGVRAADPRLGAAMVDARRRLKRASPAAFTRYLARV